MGFVCACPVGRCGKTYEAGGVHGETHRQSKSDSFLPVRARSISLTTDTAPDRTREIEHESHVIFRLAVFTSAGRHQSDDPPVGIEVELREAREFASRIVQPQWRNLRSLSVIR